MRGKKNRRKNPLTQKHEKNQNEKSFQVSTKKRKSDQKLPEVGDLGGGGDLFLAASGDDT